MSLPKPGRMRRVNDTPINDVTVKALAQLEALTEGCGHKPDGGDVNCHTCLIRVILDNALTDEAKENITHKIHELRRQRDNAKFGLIAAEHAAEARTQKLGHQFESKANELAEARTLLAHAHNQIDQLKEAGRERHPLQTAIEATAAAGRPTTMRNISDTTGYKTAALTEWAESEELADRVTTEKVGRSTLYTIAPLPPLKPAEPEQPGSSLAQMLQEQTARWTKP